MYNTHFVKLQVGRASPIDVEVRNQMYASAADAIAAATRDFPRLQSANAAVGFIIQENNGPVVGRWFSNPAIAGSLGQPS